MGVAEDIAPFIRKLERRDVLSDDERQALLDAAGATETFAAGTDMVREGDRPGRSILIASGFSIRYRVLGEGQRQITAVHLAGDFVDLHSFLLKEMDHAVGALSHCRVVTFPHANLKLITERYPHLTRLLWLMTLLDSAIHREWLVAMGRRSAIEQMAHLVCEIFTRLQVINLAELNEETVLPINQSELGDMLGLSTVHVNRTLQQLRASGLISWQGQSVRILNWQRLAEIAEFDTAYLHLGQEPR